MEKQKQEIPYLREIDFVEIEDFSVVGRGSYGTVYKARWQNQFVAVKGFEFEADPKAIETEVKQLSRVVHPNIIALYGVSIAYSRIYLVMEYAEGGSLHSFLHGSAKPYYSAAHAMSWARQCAEGVAYLHGMRPKPLIHRDLKPLNLLLVNQGRNLKICDFGTVADKSTLMTNNKGSAAWMAPEVFRGSSYTEKCDVFSWSIILWQIITREQPYKDFGLALSIMWYVNQGHRPPLIEGCPKPLEKLMIACWDQQPENRPAMRHVVDIMKVFCDYFPGSDEPLDYESPHEQQQDTNDSEEKQSQSSCNNNRLCLKNLSSNNTSSVTPTNFEHVTHLNHAINQHVTTATTTTTATTSSVETNLKSPIFKGDELETLSSEVESKFQIDQNKCTINENINDNSTNENSKLNSNLEFKINSIRSNEIRNGMLKNQHIPLEPLSIQVDPNAWELKQHDYRKIFENISKSEGKERLTVTEKKPADIPDEDEAGSIDNDDDTLNATLGVGEDTEKALHLMLDPELQPETPDPNSQLSQEIYHEHQKLAKEYLRVDTELYYATDRKEKILAAMDPEEKQEKLALIKKHMEKEELLGLYKDLKMQLEQLRAAQGISNNETDEQQMSHSANSKPSTPDEPPDQQEDGWVFIQSNQS